MRSNVLFHSSAAQFVLCLENYVSGKMTLPQGHLLHWQNFLWCISQAVTSGNHPMEVKQILISTFMLISAFIFREHSTRVSWFVCNIQPFKGKECQKRLPIKYDTKQTIPQNAVSISTKENIKEKLSDLNREICHYKTHNTRS